MIYVKVMYWVGQAQRPLEFKKFQMNGPISYCALVISVGVELQGR